METNNGDILISIQDLQVYYKIGGGLFGHTKHVKAVDGVSLEIKKGETLGLVGESLARAELLIVCGKKERAATVHTGEILVRILLHHGSYRSPGFSPPGFPGQKVIRLESVNESGFRRSRRSPKG